MTKKVGVEFDANLSDSVGAHADDLFIDIHTAQAGFEFGMRQALPAHEIRERRDRIAIGRVEPDGCSVNRSSSMAARFSAFPSQARQHEAAMAKGSDGNSRSTKRTLPVSIYFCFSAL